jgi:small acid-soluble spore protein F (minor alpha/beta-type SASP)
MIKFTRINIHNGEKIIMGNKKTLREVFLMSNRRRSVMSENLKQEIARELGVYNVVKEEGWGSVSSKNCGNMVKTAIEIAERSLNK